MQHHGSTDFGEQGHYACMPIFPLTLRCPSPTLFILFAPFLIHLSYPRGNVMLRILPYATIHFSVYERPLAAALHEGEVSVARGEQGR